MNIRQLTDEEADAMWELGIPLFRRFAYESEEMWREHARRAGSPKEDRFNYRGDDIRWVFGVWTE